MLSWKDIWVQQERYKDALHEAERERLVRQVLAGPAKKPYFYCRVLTWLGRRLVHWGWRLQERYGTASQVEVQQGASG